MFDNLSQRLTTAFRKFSGSGILSEAQVDEATKEIRRSLLEADVHFKIAREICDKFKEKAIGRKIWENLTAGQQAIQIFHEELIEALGGKEQVLPDFAGKAPVVVLVAGLQGSGKTTFCSKLGLYLKTKLRKSVGFIPADCARPAAKEQLTILGKKIEVPVFDSPLDKGAVEVAKLGLEWARAEFLDVVLVDTAGRQQVDEELMNELTAVFGAIQPQYRFLVLDSMIGSQGLEVAKIFHERVALTGICLAKLDGDSRGGVALSARGVTGVPIFFAGTGEKPQDFEPFHPERMASRILGMGDVLTLVEKARESISEEDAQSSMSKMMQGQFTLDDFKDQLKRIQNLGPLEGIMKLIPGMSQAMGQLKDANPEKEFKRVEAMINSMTREERHNPDILNGSRKLRVANGSGTQVAEINRFLRQFTEMRKMMKQFSKMGMGGKGAGLRKMLAQMNQSGKRGF